MWRERSFAEDLKVKTDVDRAVPNSKLPNFPGTPTSVCGLGMSPWAPAPPAEAQIFMFQVEFMEDNMLRSSCRWHLAVQSGTRAG